MPKKSAAEKPDEDELFAAREFGQLRKPRRSATHAERVEALRQAQALAEPLPTVPQLEQPAPLAQPLTLPKEAPVAVATAVCCRCDMVLGGQVRGVFTGGAWYCPVDFMLVRDQGAHPVARPVDCPRCHHVSVDFAGKNICPVCGAKSAQPLRRAG